MNILPNRNTVVVCMFPIKLLCCKPILKNCECIVVRLPITPKVNPMLTKCDRKDSTIISQAYPLSFCNFGSLDK